MVPSSSPPILPCIGWREWVSMPQLGVLAIKAKIDTGARTSALCACDLERYRQDKKDYVRFHVYPLQRRLDVILRCQAPLVDERVVSDSGGHRETRFVILTAFQLGAYQWETEVTLTDRLSMRFRMLLGRSAVQDRFLIDPSKSYAVGKKPAFPPEWEPSHV